MRRRHFRGPKTIVGRTVLVLMVGLFISHFISIAIYTDDRQTALLTAGGRQVSERIAAAYLNLDQTSPADRLVVIRSLWEPLFTITWTEESVLSENMLGNWRAHLVRNAILENVRGFDGDKIRIAYTNVEEFTPGITPGAGFGHNGGGGMGRGSGMGMQRHMGRMSEDDDPMQQRFNRFSRHWHGDSILNVSMQLTDGTWFNVATPGVRMRSTWLPSFFGPIVVTAVIVIILSVWAVRRSSKPIAIFAQAAERLGRDVNAPPLPEDGPREVASASRAFNDMQRKLQTFIKDRTQMLAAISHDLRTPITRLRLRAELIDDEEQQKKILADLEQMEQMITATLAFARDEAVDEPSVPFDLSAMLQSLTYDITDTQGQASFSGPDKLKWLGRPGAMKRVFQNLADNAIKYGQRVDITLKEDSRELWIFFEDDGPGIPENERERVFDPFYRVEPSRNRDTGGVGLGLAVTRSIIRAHGGDIELRDHEGRFGVVVKLPKGA